MESAASDSGELARRIQRIEDRHALSELISRYGVAVDDRDFETVAGMYRDDSEFSGVRGLKAIMAYYKERLALYGPTYHYAHTHHFDFESDLAASGVVSAHAEIGFDGKTVWMGLRYLDRYVRANGKWYFQSRMLKVRYALPLEELATAYGERLRRRWPGTAPQPGETLVTQPVS